MASGAEATAPLPRRPRTGLVLGAGGVLGAAWMAGALAALQRRLPYPVGAVDLIVGTSAGSVRAAAAAATDAGRLAPAAAQYGAGAAPGVSLGGRQRAGAAGTRPAHLVGGPGARTARLGGPRAAGHCADRRGGVGA